MDPLVDEETIEYIIRTLSSSNLNHKGVTINLGEEHSLFKKPGYDDYLRKILAGRTMIAVMDAFRISNLDYNLRTILELYISNCILKMENRRLKSYVPQNEINLTVDIWGHIGSFLDRNVDKYNLLRTCKDISECNIYFTELIDAFHIRDSQWFDKFINIMILSKTRIPSMATHIVIKNSCNLLFKNNNIFAYNSIIIPKTVKHVLIDCYGTCSIPFGISHIKFGKKVRNLIGGMIPSSVTYLKLSDDFNQSIQNDIPSSVTHLKFGYMFNQLINDCIPLSVIHLKFGSSFNQPIYNCVPSSVKILVFGASFNQPIDGCIPSSVTYLNLGLRISDELNFSWGSVFNQPIQNCIPSSVTHLLFSNNFNQSIRNGIPSSVIHLTFGANFNRSIRDRIPSSVTHLIFGHYFNRSIRNRIPSSVTHLTFGANFNHKIRGYIPSSVTHLTIGSGFRKSLHKSIPSSVIQLIINGSFCQRLSKRLLRSTQSLIFRGPVHNVDYIREHAPHAKFPDMDKI